MNDLDFSIFDDIEEALKPFKWWKVDEKGNITYLGSPKREIPAEKLTHRNWLSHLLSKKLDENAASEFYFAFLTALRNAGYSSLTIDTHDIHASIQTK